MVVDVNKLAELDPPLVSPMHEHMHQQTAMPAHLDLHICMHPDNQVVIDCTCKNALDLWEAFAIYCTGKSRNPNLSATFILLKHQRQRLQHLLGTFVNKTSEFVKQGTGIEVWVDTPNQKIMCAVIKPPKMFILQAKYGDQVVRVLLDSGATHSFINQKTATLHNYEFMHSAEVPTAVTTANNQTVSIKGTVKADLQLGKCTIKRLPLLLMPLMEDIDILLGADFLHQFKVKLDYGNYSMQLHNHNHIYEYNKACFAGMLVADAIKQAQPAPPIKSRRQLRRFLVGGGRFILTVLKPAATVAAVDGQDPQKASINPQYLSGDKILEENETIKKIPASIQGILRKYPKVFEALAPGTDDKIHITDEVIPTNPHVPPFRPMYRLTPAERAEMEKQIAIFIANGWIRPSVH